MRLNTAAWLLPLFALALLLAGVVVAPNRRRGLLVGSVMFAVAMLVLLGVLAGVRTYYLNNLPDTVQTPDAVAAVYDNRPGSITRSRPWPCCSASWR